MVQVLNASSRVYSVASTLVSGAPTLCKDEFTADTFYAAAVDPDSWQEPFTYVHELYLLIYLLITYLFVLTYHADIVQGQT